MKIGMIFTDLLHYHVARYRALAEAARERGHTALLMSMRASDPSLPRPGEHARLGDQVQVIAPGATTVDDRATCARLWDTLDRERPDVMFIPGYSSRYARTILRWTRRRGAGAVLMSESRAEDFPRSGWREGVKRSLLRNFDAAFVGGQPHERYALALGFERSQIRCGYDVVDNQFWNEQAANVRADPEWWRAEIGVEGPYFFAASRFVPKKNLFRLVDGYARYHRQSSVSPWPLMIAGGGELEAAVRQRVSDHGLESWVHLPGYVAAEGLVPYYALAGAFVHASDRSEQWGLVVNEAMAAALPVLVSQTVGCVEDLVTSGQTGYTFDPFDSHEISAALARMAALPDEERRRIGEQAQQRIGKYSLERFGSTAVELAEQVVQWPRATRMWMLHPLMWI